MAQADATNLSRRELTDKDMGSLLAFRTAFSAIMKTIDEVEELHKKSVDVNDESTSAAESASADQQEGLSVDQQEGLSADQQEGLAAKGQDNDMEMLL